MNPGNYSINMILRRKDLEIFTGLSRSTIYLQVATGLLTRPVALGARAVGWPLPEIEVLTAARIAGKTESEIRKLVAQLHARRAVETPLSHTGVRADREAASATEGACA